MLTVRQLTGSYNIPGGTANLSESSRCTAFRETWEESGQRVRVGPLLKEMSNGFRIYRCELENTGEAFKTNSPLEVMSVQWTNPVTLPEGEWRFPRQAQFYAGWLTPPEGN